MVLKAWCPKQPRQGDSGGLLEMQVPSQAPLTPPELQCPLGSAAYFPQALRVALVLAKVSQRPPCTVLYFKFGFLEQDGT